MYTTVGEIGKTSGVSLGLDLLVCTAAGVCIGCVLGSECGQDRGPVGSPKALEMVDRDSEGGGGLLCVSVRGRLARDGGVVQEAPDKVKEGGDASPTERNHIGLCGNHGNIQVGFVLGEPRLQTSFVDISRALGLGEGNVQQKYGSQLPVEGQPGQEKTEGLLECEEGTDDSPIRGKCLEGVGSRMGQGLVCRVGRQREREPGAEDVGDEGHEHGGEEAGDT